MEHQAQPAEYRDQDTAGDQADQKQATRRFVKTAAREQDRDHPGQQHDVRDGTPRVVMNGRVEDRPACETANREDDGAVACPKPGQARDDE